MWWSLSAQPISGHPNHHGRDGDAAAEYSEPTNPAHQDGGYQDQDQCNVNGDQTHTGRTSKQTYEDVVPPSTGPMPPDNRDAGWYQENEPKNDNQRDVQHGKFSDFPILRAAGAAQPWSQWPGCRHSNPRQPPATKTRPQQYHRRESGQCVNRHPVQARLQRKAER